jgi:hypothetical protein
METFSPVIDFNAVAYGFWSPLCAYLMLPFFVWALIKQRFAYVIVITQVTAAGVGFTEMIGSITFAKISFGLCMCTLAWQAFLIFVKTKGVVDIPLKRFPRYTAWIFALLVVVSIKAGVDTFTLGLDQYREAAWKRMFISVALPTAVAVAGFILRPTRDYLEDFFKATLLLFGIWIVTGLAAALQHDPASLFLTGERRLQLHNNDTINTVRPVPMFMIAMCWLALPHQGKKWVPIGYAGMFISVLIVILSGTRQVAISCVLIALLFLLMRGQGRIAGGILFFALAAYIPYSQLRESSLFARVGTEGMTDYGRIDIWTSAYRGVMESPLTGLGFREWGDVIVGWDKGTGLPIDNKDTAHGLFQDIAVDHGLILGFAFLVAYLLTAVSATLQLLRKVDPLEKLGAVAFVGISVSFFFSGAYQSCDGFVLALLVYVFAAVATRGKVGEQIQSAPLLKEKMSGSMSIR